MYVEVHPGQENKVLVNEIKKAIAVYMKSACDAEQRRIMEDNLYELTEKYSPNEVMDALYYACKDGKRMLDMQAEYFLAQLNTDEFEYYVDRFFSELGHSW